MVQVIDQQGSIAGRIGKGFGQGLAEQVPKEIERYRLSSGLQALEKDASNLSPIQLLSRAAAIPGATPQLIQSVTELAKMQNQTNAFRRGDQQRPGEPPQTQAPAPAQNQPSPNAMAAQAGIAGQRNARIMTPGTLEGIENESQIADRSLARAPWTPAQRNSRIVDYVNQGFLIDKARELAADDEERYLKEPQAYETRLGQLKAKSEEARSELRRQLETKLQKKGEDLFKDVTGEMLINAERGMERDIRTNPNLSFKEIANDWSNRMLDLAKTKSQFDKLANTTGVETFFKGDQTLKKLQSYQKSFKEAGNLEEYYNLLKKDFGLSPQGAASIAFPLSNGIRKFIGDYKPKRSAFTGTTPDINKIQGNSRKLALNIEKYLDTDDSLLAIARTLSEKDPYFDQQSFFDQLNEDREILQLNGRQKRELDEGVRDILPTWGDIKILPLIRR